MQDLRTWWPTHSCDPTPPPFSFRWLREERVCDVTNALSCKLQRSYWFASRDCQSRFDLFVCFLFPSPQTDLKPICPPCLQRTSCSQCMPTMIFFKLLPFALWASLAHSTVPFYFNAMQYFQRWPKLSRKLKVAYSIAAYLQSLADAERLLYAWIVPVVACLFRGNARSSLGIRDLVMNLAFMPLVAPRYVAKQISKFITWRACYNYGVIHRLNQGFQTFLWPCTTSTFR